MPFRRIALRNLSLALIVAMYSVPADGSDRPNILWIVAEDISPMFGCYDAADAITPNIDSFAKRSHLFRHAYTTAPICSPSRSCLATGMYATSLGSQHLRCKVQLPNEIKPLAQLFRENGYWTSLIGKTDYNFNDQHLFDHRSGNREKPPWTECPKDKPFYAFWNLGSTHEGSGNRPERAAEALAKLPASAKRDPNRITVPPHHPNSEEMRRIWARYHELITVFDLEFGAAMSKLEEDGLAENTVVFLMSDHGMGLPRYKRWLYSTGLHVPLIVHLPKRYRGDLPEVAIQESLTSYVDLPATALRLAGIEKPDYFAGQDIFQSPPREYIFGARDRADDMYDLSRCIFDGRYLYIRHYLPHLPPMQEGYILSPVYKESLIELHRLHAAGLDTPQSAKLWKPRPFEELYDLHGDPHEENNVADRENLKEIKTELARELKTWITETRDSGFLTEPEMHRRAISNKTAQHTILQSDLTYPITEILNAADQASRPDGLKLFGGEDPALTYWAIQQRIIRNDQSPVATQFFHEQLTNENAMVRATAAGALARIGRTESAIPIFRELLAVQEPNLKLYVARTMATSFESIVELENEVRLAREGLLAPPGSGRPWKDFLYSAFTAWALEWSLVKSKLNQWGDFKGL